MSYRRQSEREQRWRIFRDEHSPLAGEVGLPDECFSREETFVEFLLHGFIRKGSGAPGFLSEEMSPAQYGCFLELFHHYFAAGFPYFTAMAVRGTAELDQLERLFGNR